MVIRWTSPFSSPRRSGRVYWNPLHGCTSLKRGQTRHCQALKKEKQKIKSGVWGRSAIYSHQQIKAVELSALFYHLYYFQGQDYILPSLLFLHFPKARRGAHRGPIRLAFWLFRVWMYTWSQHLCDTFLCYVAFDPWLLVICTESRAQLRRSLQLRLQARTAEDSGWLMFITTINPCSVWGHGVGFRLLSKKNILPFPAKNLSMKMLKSGIFSSVRMNLEKW